MTIILIHWLMLAGFSIQAQQSPSYTQTYLIYIRGAQVGSETVSERIDKDGNRVVESQDEMFVSDGLGTKRMAFETTMVFAKDTTVPTRYLYRYTSGDTKDYCEVTIKGAKITRVLSRGGNVSETTADFQPGMVIVDFNVFYQYDVLSRIYNFKKGGRQIFSDFIPVIGNDLQLAVTWLEDSQLAYEKGSVPVRNFKIEFVGVRAGNYSTDKNGRLVRLIMREQDLEVVRKDLVPEK